MKHIFRRVSDDLRKPAAFRRLCVETENRKAVFRRLDPAAFRRLCVETILISD